MTDHACFVVLPALVRRLKTAAPRLGLEVIASHDRRFEDLASGKLDLVLDAAGRRLTCSAKRSSRTSLSASSLPSTRYTRGD
jgi:DNA-binding transcriptional LysR family regulator